MEMAVKKPLSKAARDAGLRPQAMAPLYQAAVPALFEAELARGREVAAYRAAAAGFKKAAAMQTTLRAQQPQPSAEVAVKAEAEAAAAARAEAAAATRAGADAARAEAEAAAAAVRAEAAAAARTEEAAAARTEAAAARADTAAARAEAAEAARAQAAAEAEAAAARAQAEAARAEVAAARAEADMLRGGLEDAARRCNRYRGEAEIARAEAAAALRGALDGAQRARDDAEASAAAARTAEAGRAAAEAARAAADAAAAAALLAQRDAEAVAEKARESFAEYRAKQEKRKAGYRALEEEREDNAKEVEKLRKQLREAEAQRAASDARRLRAKERLDALRRECEARSAPAQERLSALQRECDAQSARAKERLDALQRECDTQRRRREAAERDLASLRAKVEGAEARERQDAASQQARAGYLSLPFDQRWEVHTVHMDALLSSLEGKHINTCVVFKVTRGRVLHDVVKKALQLQMKQMRQRIAVEFVRAPTARGKKAWTEDGVDEGGLTKEMFGSRSLLSAAALPRPAGIFWDALQGTGEGAAAALNTGADTASAPVRWFKPNDDSEALLPLTDDEVAALSLDDARQCVRCAFLSGVAELRCVVAVLALQAEDVYKAFGIMLAKLVIEVAHVLRDGDSVKQSLVPSRLVPGWLWDVLLNREWVRKGPGGQVALQQWFRYVSVKIFLQQRCLCDRHCSRAVGAKRTPHNSAADKLSKDDNCVCTYACAQDVYDDLRATSGTGEVLLRVTQDDAGMRYIAANNVRASWVDDCSCSSDTDSELLSWDAIPAFVRTLFYKRFIKTRARVLGWITDGFRWEQTNLVTLQTFTRRELRDMFSGIENVSEEQLKQCLHFKDRDNLKWSSPNFKKTRQYLLQALESAEFRQKLLRWTTGLSAIAAANGSTPSVKITVRPGVSSDAGSALTIDGEYLPEASTCGSELRLPAYASLDALVAKMEQAMVQTTFESK
ncbi:hypothetical protein JKP88DRAFT_313115 [Tribonema minus]|uniref:HECT domain-containing protein n=1 Tax=Tribonema minus TaxID=303371 RepID=A0A835ZA55_9STRA|nr:hypothetical protein JKP88DRAFT_313115 [Tribonema minus]